MLTCELLDELPVNTSARVVDVASVYASDVDLDNAEFERRPYDGMRAYAVTVNAVAPGLVLDTAALYRDLPADI